MIAVACAKYSERGRGKSSKPASKICQPVQTLAAPQAITSDEDVRFAPQDPPSSTRLPRSSNTMPDSMSRVYSWLNPSSRGQDCSALASSSSADLSQGKGLRNRNPPQDFTGGHRHHELRDPSRTNVEPTQSLQPRYTDGVTNRREIKAYSSSSDDYLALESKLNLDAGHTSASFNHIGATQSLNRSHDLKPLITNTLSSVRRRSRINKCLSTSVSLPAITAWQSPTDRNSDMSAIRPRPQANGLPTSKTFSGGFLARNSGAWAVRREYPPLKDKIDLFESLAGKDHPPVTLSVTDSTRDNHFDMSMQRIHNGIASSKGVKSKLQDVFRRVPNSQTRGRSCRQDATPHAESAPPGRQGRHRADQQTMWPDRECSDAARNLRFIPGTRPKRRSLIRQWSKSMPATGTAWRRHRQCLHFSSEPGGPYGLSCSVTHVDLLSPSECRCGTTGYRSRLRRNSWARRWRPLS
jgi:hypothetical protein